jgi:hypothetical protein
MTNQAAPIPVEPTTPTTSDELPAVPTLDVVHNVAGAVERQRARRAAALEAVGEPPAPAPTPRPAAATPAAQQAAADPGVEIEIDVPDEQALLENAKRRLEERAQRAPFDSLAARFDALEKRLGQLPSGPALPIAALKSDDGAAVLAALKSAGLDPNAFLKTLTKAQHAPSVLDQVGALIEAKLAPVIERLTPAQQQAQAEPMISVDEVKGNYAAYLEGSAGRWPWLDAKREELGSEAVADLVFQYARRLNLSGVDTRDLTEPQLSAMFVKKYAPSGASPPGAPSASGGTLSPSGASSASGGPTRTSAPPRTVTAGLAANAGPAAPPANDQERFSRAVERQRARLSKA